MPVSYELENKWQAWIKGGALGSEMETAALYCVSQVLRVHAGEMCIRDRSRAPCAHRGKGRGCSFSAFGSDPCVPVSYTHLAVAQSIQRILQNQNVGAPVAAANGRVSARAAAGGLAVAPADMHPGRGH